MDSRRYRVIAHVKNYGKSQLLTALINGLAMLVKNEHALIVVVKLYALKTELYKMLDIAFLILAIMASNCAASMLWSRYCPSLRDTGMVSSATGFLDFCERCGTEINSRMLEFLTRAGAYGICLRGRRFRRDSSGKTAPQP